MQSYQAARGLFGFLGFCSWIVIIVGGLAAFGGFATAASTVRNASVITSLLWTAPGLLLAVVGLYGLALIQMGRAGVDTAEYTQQMLKVTRDHFEHSKRAYADLHQSSDDPAGYATTSSLGPENISYDTEAPEAGYAAMDQPEALPDTAPLTFEGKTIEQSETGFLIEGQTFPTLEDAKSFVLSLPSEPLEEAVLAKADSETNRPTALGYEDLAEPEIQEADEVMAAPEPEEISEPDQTSVITALFATDTTTHSGTTIDHVEGGYRIDSDFFDSLDDAKQAIENPNLRPLLTRKYPV